jgi:HlyD family secretion protein
MPGSSTPVLPPERASGRNGADQQPANDRRTVAAPRPTSRDGVAHNDVAATLGLAGGASRGATLARRLLRWGIPIVAIAGAAFYFMSRHTQAPVRYQTVAARRGDLSATVTATGTLAALDTVAVGSEVSGIVDVVRADYNDRVQKGQTLAIVNTDQLRAQIRQGEAALQAAQATAQQTAATIVETRGQTVRAESLFADRMISSQEVESARASLARALAADASARAQIAASTAALQAQHTVLEKATIRSPITGVVLQRQIEPGRTVAASFQTPVLFILAADLKQMTLALDIDEADVGQISAGQEGEFTVDAYPDRTFNARVRSVRNAAKTVEGVVTYQAILDVANPDLALRPGMTATAVVRTAQVHNALSVPNAALRFTPARDSSALTASVISAARRSGNAHQVWTLRQGAPVAIALTTGVTDGQWTQVTGGSLTSGLPLITGVVEQGAATTTSADSSANRRSPAPLPSPGAR